VGSGSRRLWHIRHERDKCARDAAAIARRRRRCPPGVKIKNAASPDKALERRARGDYFASFGGGLCNRNGIYELLALRPLESDSFRTLRAEEAAAVRGAAFSASFPPAHWFRTWSPRFWPEPCGVLCGTRANEAGRGGAKRRLQWRGGYFVRGAPRSETRTQPLSFCMLNRR